MSLTDRKITGYENNIKDLPDTVIGKAQWLKEQFDGRGDKEIKEAINGIIDDLLNPAAAAEIGAAVPAGVEADAATVQGVLKGLQKYTDQKVVDIGAGDMAQAVYDPSHREKDIFEFAETHRNATAELQSGVLVIASVEVRTGTDYDVVFTAPADFDETHTYTIDGAVVTLCDLNGEKLSNTWKEGAPVTLARRGGKAFYSGVNKTYVFIDDAEQWDGKTYFNTGENENGEKLYKPWYSRTLKTTTDMAKTVLFADHGFINIEFILFDKGHLVEPAGGIRPLPWVAFSVLNASVTVYGITPTQFVIETGNAGYKDWAANLTFKYTKTTDTAKTKAEIAAGI